MRSTWRRFALLCLVAGSAIAIVVPGGSAGNRTADASFDALPGTRVTVGQNIAYRATFTNVGKSTFTHVIFRMRVPFVSASGSQPYAEASFVRSTCPSLPLVVTTSGGPEWTCDFGKLSPGTPGTPQLVITTLWSPPTPVAGSCDGCLETTSRWTIKEGVNDVATPNDTIVPPGVPIDASLLSSNSPVEAGGYATNGVQCSDPLGAGSLTTNQDLSTDNVTSTTICLPSQLPTGAFDLGLATAIVEEPHQNGDPGHPQFDASNVCIAALGEACRDGYTPADLSPKVTTIVLRGDADVLPKNEKVTAVYHDGVLLPSCPTNGSTPAKGCVVSITLVQQRGGWHTTARLSGGHDDDHHGTKSGGVWIAVVRSSTNGHFSW